MRIFYFKRSAGRRGNECWEPLEDGLSSYTVVLQEAAGPVGLGSGGDDEVASAIAGTCVILDISNNPSWTLPVRVPSAPPLSAQLYGRISCRAPSPSFLSELELVRLNEVTGKKNRILARHGKPATPLEPTFFATWVSESGHIRAAGIPWLLERCMSLTHWSQSEWGLYATILGQTEEDALGPLFQIERTLGIPLSQVSSERDLPCW